LSDSAIDDLLILACGTSYNAGLVAKYIFEELLKSPVRVEFASEFNYYPHTLARKMAIVITQSGETADVIRAVRRLQGANYRVIAITNVVGSTISRLANQTVYTSAGPEMSVASTKSFIAQLVLLYWLAMSYSHAEADRLAEMLMSLRHLLTGVQQVLDNEESIIEHGRYLAGYKNAFFIGGASTTPSLSRGRSS
jgi:glucosamine--fructose-6-phosphate aminotransferase (isomerizing)